MKGARTGTLAARNIQVCKSAQCSRLLSDNGPLISAAVVLGLSITLYHNFDLLRDLRRTDADGRRERELCDEAISRWPSSLIFAAITGAFGLLDFFLGLVAVFLTSLPAIAVLIVDTLAAIFYLAGGINLAVLYPHWQDQRCGAGGNSNLCPGGTSITKVIAFHFIGFVATMVALVFVFLSCRFSRNAS